ncbi:tRNA (N6-isopentenyl adenosine(37)-C2)-methylthiotransferase MiaB [Candidatus Chlorohelix sp.]|uniref:tRNA (N6-isopentenyl adenosine(37)-C2)-methylthiotransferase MiaB n=1 Tax=Candidatus Chlorohelix sp. TaxID=3139201 RepID=UPI00304FC683
MKQYHIHTIGCQMNVADSIRIGSALEQTGYTFTDEIGDADVVVVNTCSVRQRAEDSAAGKLGQLVSFKRQNHNLVVAMTGCMVPREEAGKAALYKRFPVIDLLFDTLDPQRLVELLPEHTEQPQVGASIKNKIGITAFVSVIYGCNYTCSYCIVPLRRGQEQSRPVEEIVEEIKGYVRRGVREVTLLGQTVDAYGHDLPTRPDLADLLQAVNDIEGLWRIRFLTSHPKMMSYKIIKAVADLPKVCEYFSLPIQHGDDQVLKAMKRPYTVAFYEKLADTIRKTVPNLSLSTDIIVGFPGETEQQFLDTYRLLERMKFNEVHVAAYSPRPGTVSAEQIEDNVPMEVKRERLQAVEQLQEKIAWEYSRALVGTTQEILVERMEKGRWHGRTRNNKPVFFDNPPLPEYEGFDWHGKLVDVVIEKAGAWSLVGHIVGTPTITTQAQVETEACEVESVAGKRLIPLTLAHN